MSSSASWVQFGPSTGLAYLLYQKGYDVWMLNTRGNIYSQEHNEKRIGDSSYWDFSFHDIGQYDIPAAIDYILAKTNRLDLQYIGHSQGSTAFYVMCSERPEYAAKVKLMQSLSPAVFVRNAISPALKFLSGFKGGLNTVFSLLGGYKITLHNKLIDMFRKNICSANLVTSRICAIFEFVVCGFNWRNFNQTLSAIVEGHASQGGSAKQIYHYAQMLGRSIFQRYDYGLILNRIRYKSNYPPSYNLSQVSGKVAIHYGEGDWVGSESDAVQLQQSLPNCIENRKINSQAFAHYDFIISKDVRPLVYTRIINLCDSNR
ncbi:LOW QUALITY PROTEIN: lipase 3-like [Drosophila eugracilis]|uniref:LOW QUALITY PROTEIN: lipase 3-like n=1 Tax=Drosophila eugracilis TaxID=29029 RepID=UPI001BDAD12D|nr:LOW QUALITY PROTEIN: lipase 3-like [Drosophila eugracilis]